VVLFQSGGQFLDANIGSLYVDDGYMYMVINTIYYAEKYGEIRVDREEYTSSPPSLSSSRIGDLFVLLVLSSPRRCDELIFSSGMVVSVQNNMTTNARLHLISDIDPSTGPNPHPQSFTFKSTNTSTIYDGMYTFVFSALDCPSSTDTPDQCTNSTDFVYTFKVVLRVEDDTDLYTSLRFDVEIYDDDRFQVPHVDVSIHQKKEHHRSSRIDSSDPNPTAFLFRKRRMLQERSERRRRGQ
jgi:hypothetical protein